MRETPSRFAVLCVVDVVMPLVPTSPTDGSECGKRPRDGDKPVKTQSQDEVAREFPKPVRLGWH